MIYAINGYTWGTLPHISQEILEVSPTVTNLDTASPI